DAANKVYVCENGMIIKFEPLLDLSDFSVNGRFGANTNALATAKSIQNELHDPSRVAILTGDTYMSSKALANGIDVVRINPTEYTGRRKLKLPEELYGPWFKDRTITAEQFRSCFHSVSPLLLNEFVEFVVDPVIAEAYGIHNPNNLISFIGRFEPNEDGEGTLRRLHYVEDLPRHIQPRSSGQYMLAEALMAPSEEIPIVICPARFGTGKTYLAVSIGDHLTTDEKARRYDRIFVVPRDAELGKEIGFLPGDETQKTLAKAMPIVDNLYNYFKNKGDRKKGNCEQTSQDIRRKVDLAIQDHFEFVSIINMGGRSISDSWINYDEAQDMERFQINQLMKRIGEGSKMVITGDPHQVFNKHMDYHSNGLMYAATKMAGSPYAAVVSMLECEITRSVAAREIARRLDN
ncbi:PhoH family protein, partial [Candidatus Saccharibacteria bacterium]|nr:PhoH family protein [Candidatus Saccharibacteria bacterium]